MKRGLAPAKLHWKPLQLICQASDVAIPHRLVGHKSSLGTEALIRAIAPPQSPLFVEATPNG